MRDIFPPLKFGFWFFVAESADLAWVGSWRIHEKLLQSMIFWVFGLANLISKILRPLQGYTCRT